MYFEILQRYVPAPLARAILCRSYGYAPNMAELYGELRWLQRSEPDLFDDLDEESALELVDIVLLNLPYRRGEKNSCREEK